MSGEIGLVGGAQPVLTDEIGVELLNRLIASTTLKVLRGAIGARELADGAITQAKLQETFVRQVVLRTGAVTTPKIVDGALATGDLHDDAVTAAKIAANVAGDGLTQAADGSLEPDPAATLDLGGAGSTLQVADESVDSEHIQDANVTAAQIAEPAAASFNFADGSVTGDQLGADAVTQAKLAAGAYGTNVLDVETVNDNSTLTGERLVTLRDVSGWASTKQLLVLVLVQVGKATHSAGTCAFRLTTDNASFVQTAVLHEASVTLSASTRQWVLLGGYVDGFNDKYLGVYSELGTAGGRIVGDLVWLVVDASKRQVVA